MPGDRPTGEAIPLTVWLEELAETLSPSGGPGPSEEENAALLDIARIAAHSSERIAAPLSTYMAGLACAKLPSAERAEALRSLVRRLEG